MRRQMAPQAYIYIYIYACCEVVIWAKFGRFNSDYLGQVRDIIWTKVIFNLYLEWVLGDLLLLNYHFVWCVCVCVCARFLCPFFCQFLKNSLFFSKKGSEICFPNFLCFKFNFRKSLSLGSLKHYKNRGFSVLAFFVFSLLKEKRIGKKR